MNIEKKNLFLSDTKERIDYTSAGRFGTNKFPIRDNAKNHSQYIIEKIHRCNQENLSSKQVAAIRHKEGMYLEFSGLQDYDLKVQSLENRVQGIRLLKVWEEDQTKKALVYVPAGKESYFLKKVESYGEEVLPGKNPKNNDLVRTIEDVQLATIRSFWVGKTNDMPNENPCACEIWFRYDDKNSKLDDVCSNVREICSQYGIPIDDGRIVFPERVVLLVTATLEQLGTIIKCCDYVAEIRRAPIISDFFESLSKAEQSDWMDDLLSRTNFIESDVSVCLLDTGINNLHPLLNPYTSEDRIDTTYPDWGTEDKWNHGTGMASIALYDDLEDCLASTDTFEIDFCIESIKILPNKGDNPPKLYGEITKQAIFMAETAHPETRRSVCMAVTSEAHNTEDGSPTSWSASIDALASGVDNPRAKRLFFISAGNVDCSEYNRVGYPDCNKLHIVENPGQAWNAVTVGGYANKIQITDPVFSGFKPVADALELSPYSSTSALYGKKWPIKPEIVLDAGNMATNDDDFTDCPDLSLLCANAEISSSFFTSFNGTSPATAKAARLAAKLMTAYPSIWPETVRALIVHSAEWTENMRKQFIKTDNDDSKRKGRKELLRCCGYGIPNLNRAIQCLDNSVNMVIEGELQPYIKVGSKTKMKDMDLHTLPWPRDVLMSLGETEVKLKVTLSYFIEPGPGEIGWKDRYRYPSCGLRFDIINNNETIADFRKRVNVKERGEDTHDSGEGTSGSERWYLGSENRDVGSIHSDFIETSAVDLCDINKIAVYPVIGWWRERSYLGKCNHKIRYSLIVSLSTPKADVDLYTPIINQIKNTIETKIQT